MSNADGSGPDVTPLVPDPEATGPSPSPTNVVLATTVAPLDLDGTTAVAIGTALWAVAGAVLLFFRDRLTDAGNEWWLWTCLAGFGLGLLGYAYCRRRRDRATAERR